MLDLTLPGADQRLVDVLGEEEVDTVVHAAFFTNPRRDAAYSHELESIGTLHLAAAAAAAGVSHFVLRSFTAVYGARGQNPNFLTEEHPPQPPPALAWARDKLEAEQHAASFARRYPSLGLTVLRFAPSSGPGSTPSTRGSSASAWCRCSWATTRSSSSFTPTTRWTPWKRRWRTARAAW